MSDYRDVEALSSAGIPIYAETGRNGGIYLLQEFILDRAILKAVLAAQAQEIYKKNKP